MPIRQYRNNVAARFTSLAQPEPFLQLSGEIFDALGWRNDTVKVAEVIAQPLPSVQNFHPKVRREVISAVLHAMEANWRQDDEADGVEFVAYGRFKFVVSRGAIARGEHPA